MKIDGNDARAVLCVRAVCACARKVSCTRTMNTRSIRPGSSGSMDAGSYRTMYVVDLMFDGVCCVAAAARNTEIRIDVCVRIWSGSIMFDLRYEYIIDLPYGSGGERGMFIRSCC